MAPPAFHRMIGSELRRVAGRTPLLRRAQQWKALRALRTWTDLDQARVDFYKQFIGPRDLVFDVGANMANRTRLFRILCDRVVAVEPQHACLEVLRQAFARDPRVTIVDAALGASEGRADLHVGAAHVLATLSTEFIRNAHDTKRFGDEEWTTTQPVRVTTLDALIAMYGVPAFIKIDVEGYELQVLSGLSRAVPALSFEFLPDRPDAIRACMDKLERLGDVRYNVVLGESTSFSEREWRPREVILDRIEHLAGRLDVFGDVYARFL